MEKKDFTLAVYSENRPGLLNRVTMLFVKRHINIESITVSGSEIKDISRYTIMINCTEVTVQKLVGQIEKQIEVVRAYYHPTAALVTQEIALYKVELKSWNANNLQEITESNNGKVTFLDDRIVVIQKSGKRAGIDKLDNELEPFGLMQFVRSGGVAVSKTEMAVSQLIN